jgi:squalene-associated FAD-dependent desaturase
MTVASRIHVVGAGLAGLAAALSLADAGIAVILHEAAPQAGGRCRSYFDATLGCRIDNGNHLMIAGNRAAMSYLAAIGAAASLVGPPDAAYPFLDRQTGERWVLRPNAGRLPWWLFAPARRVKGTGAGDYFAALRLLAARPAQSVADILDPGALLFRRLWQPMAVAALNTEVQEASATLFGRVLRDSLGAGGAACVPLVPREGLSESLIDPALRFLAGKGAEIRFGSRLRAVHCAGQQVTALDFDGGSEQLASSAAAVLAVPAPVASRLVPGITAPDAFRGIVNAHYRISLPAAAPFFVGLIGGVAEWVFRKPNVLSVTVSAAERLIDMPGEELAPLLWRDVAAAYDLGTAAMPEWQIVKERRATFAATPAQLVRRPGTATRWSNLALAGDWTATGLPATIEGAIRSGFAAASLLGGRMKIA